MPLARPARRLAWILVWAIPLGVGALAAGDARADCQPDPAVAGQTVTCTGTDDTDGFAAGVGVDELDVLVEGTASVENTGASAIQVNDLNTVEVESGGAVTASGASSHGVEIGDDNDAGTSTNGTPDGVTNAGTITVSGDDSGGILGGNANSVTNQGTIGAGGTGISNPFGIRLGDDAMVTNESGGNLAVTGDGAVGIEVGNHSGPGMDGNLVNEGNVTVNGEDGAAAGIVAGNGNDLRNGGFVDVTVGDMGTSDAVGVRLGDQNAFDNTGRVSATSGDTMGTGVGVEIGDDNTITNSGRIETVGEGGTGIRATGAASTNSITNQGIITTNGDDGPAIDLSLSTGGTNTIISTGALSSGDTDTPGTAILGSTGVEDVTLGGTVIGDVRLGGAADTVTLNTGINRTGMLDGETGADVLNLQGGGFGTVDLDTVLDFDSLEIDDMGTGGAWRLSGAASFPSGAVLESGAIELRETATITGDFTLRNESVLGIVIDPAAGTAGQLDLDGGSTFTRDGADTELAVVFVTPLVDDTTFTLVDATDGGGSVAAGSFGTTTADTALLTFNVLTTADQIQLQVLRASYASVAETPNQRATGTYLDRVLRATGNGAGVSETLVELDGLDAASLRETFDALHPEPYDAHTGAMAALGRAFADAASRPRLLCKPPFVGLDPGSRADVPCGRTGFAAWMRLLISDWERDAGSDFFESDGTHQALAGGFDWRVHRNVQVTGCLGIGSIDLDVHDGGDGEVQTFEIGSAVHARLGGARARAAFGYGRGQHEQDRRVRFGSRDDSVEAEYDSNRLHGLLELGWLFELGGFQIEPLAGFDVSWVQEEAFGESDLDGLELEVAERDNTIVSTEFGGRVLYRHHVSAYRDSWLPIFQGTWTPELSARWRSTWTGADREIEARLAGAGPGAGDFTVEAEDSEQGVDVGARLTFQPHGGGGSFSIGYDGFIGDAGTSHRFGADLEIFF